jgi:hypothetical protein
MQLETLTFSRAAGWSIRPFPPLDSPQTLLVVFASPGFGDDAGPIEDLRASYPRSLLVGCSSAGEISGARVADESLSVAIARLEHSRVALARAHVAQQADSHAAGCRLAQELAGEDLRAILLLCDGVTVNGSELVRGINAHVGPEVTVTGGMAGDGTRFERTWLIGAEGPEVGLVTAVGLYGERLRVGHGSRGGWVCFGPERLVTRSRGNVLYELDGQPALDLYRTYLGEMAAELPASALHFPLAVREKRRDEKLLVRTILSVDEHERSMTFAGDVREGAFVQLMRANFEGLVDGACEAAGEACRTARADGVPADTLAIAISCVGRRMILGERVEDELEATLAALPSGSRQVGFYSYGEMAPFRDGPCEMHNQTMTLTTLSES